MPKKLPTPRTTTLLLTPGERGALKMTLGGPPRSVYDEDGLRDSLYWAGWEIAPGEDPQGLFPSGGQLRLARSERGMLEDQASEVWGKVPFDETADAYALAAVAAIQARGGRIAEWDVHVDEDRRIYITLGEDDEGREPGEEQPLRWVVSWMDASGWFTFLEAAPDESLGSCVNDVACPVMALPEDVAAEVSHLWGGAPAGEPLPGLEEPGRNWRPPHGYVQDPPVTGDATDVVLDLERSLAAYLNHPAVTTGDQAYAARVATRR
ncbi:hypothetical protein [Streptomyces murinus]|uniref:hypothetical protein n=1 Tax=Streptomyces murinus TaxID=33900 RepID=UPI003818DAEA